MNTDLSPSLELLQKLPPIRQTLELGETREIVMEQVVAPAAVVAFLEAELRWLVVFGVPVADLRVSTMQSGRRHALGVEHG
jgi:hypothetical protein